MTEQKAENKYIRNGLNVEYLRGFLNEASVLHIVPEQAPPEKELKEPEPSKTDGAWRFDHHNFEQHFHQYMNDRRRQAPEPLFYPVYPVRPIETIPGETAPAVPVQPIETIPAVPVQPVEPVQPVLPEPIALPPVEPARPAPPYYCVPCRPPVQPVFPGYARNLPPYVVTRMQEALDDMKSFKYRLDYLGNQARFENLRADFRRISDIKDRDTALAEAFFRDITGLRPLEYGVEEYRGVPSEVLLRRVALDQRALIGKLADLNRWFSRTYAAGRLDGIVRAEAAAADELERLIRIY
ncbi:hypothetical protein FACS1894211_02730 [Clostridia bacterium]|nr:hypothetical protein FACS1894211_02730 [Clostridia bacterium]